MSNYTISSHGDLGDIISLMPIARALGNAEILVSDHPMCKPITVPNRFHAIKPLVESQGYVTRFDVHRGETITHDAASFRNGDLTYGKNLAELHAEWVKVPITLEPWITVEPDERFLGAVVVNRSTRHRSDLMNWAPVLRHYEKDAVFLGTREEYQQLVNETGVTSLRYHPTTDLLECAKIIAAGRAFLGNQSCLINISIAMGKKFLMECSLSSLDCIYPRDCYYSLDGGVDNFCIDGYEPLNIEGAVLHRTVDFSVSPPGSYWYLTGNDGVERRSFSHKRLLKETNAAEAASGIHLSSERDLSRQLFKRHPSYNSSDHNNGIILQIDGAKRIIRKVLTEKWDKNR